jgi:hypothetical protein
MAIERFMRERSESTEFIDELRDVIVGESSKRVKGIGDGGKGVYMRFFLSVGNTAYRSGDADVFEYYLRSLFEVVKAGPEGVNCDSLLERVRGYGFRSLRDFDLAMFGAVVEVVVEGIFSMRDVGEIGGRLEFLRDLGLHSVDAGFEGGVLAVVDVYRLLGVHFEDKGLGVSSMSLKGHVVGLVHYLGGVGDDGLKGRVISRLEGVLAPPRSIEAPVEAGMGADSPPVN